jgi:hypothetical protein
MMQKKSLEQLEQVQQILRSYDFALTLRQIYYQLVAKQIIPNQENQYKSCLGCALSVGMKVCCRKMPLPTD